MGMHQNRRYYRNQYSWLWYKNSPYRAYDPAQLCTHTLAVPVRKVIIGLASAHPIWCADTDGSIVSILLCCNDTCLPQILVRNFEHLST